MKFSRSAILVGMSAVQSGRLGSLFSLCNAACTTPCIGTLVKSDSTSKDTMTLSLFFRLSFFTLKSEVLVRGDKIFAMKPDKS